MPFSYTQSIQLSSIQLHSNSESPPVWKRAANTVCHILFVCWRHFVLGSLLAGFGIWLYQFLIHALFNFYFDIVLATHLIYWKEKETQGRVFFLLILTIFYGVYYSHTLLQIVLWMWTAGIRVFGRCAIYPVCEIIQPCTTQCIARTIRKAKISCKTSMFKPSAQDFLTPFGTLQRYTTLFDSFTDFSFHFYATLNFFSIMVRLTDVQRGRAIALLMQGQRQQQVANHFGVNVSTIERLVRRLRETEYLADWPRSGRPRVTSTNFSEDCWKSIAWDWSSSSSSIRWSASDPGT